MSEQSSVPGNAGSSISAKDILGIGFRHKRIIAVCFFAVFLGAVLVGVFSPASYKAHTKLLLKRERVDPVISPGQEAQVVMQNEVSEEELNSEVELLEGDDVLQQVVATCGLQARPSRLSFGKANATEQTAKAIKLLRSSLQVEVMKKTNLISVTYSADDPQLAAKVLRSLNDTYIQRNAEVHRPQGQYKFFEQEADRYEAQLGQAEQQLKQFASEQGGVAPQVARDQTLQKLTEFSATLQQTRASMSATEQKILALEKQGQTVPARITTQLRESDNAQVLQQMKTTLMNLELKRTELLTKYQPTYPLVQEVDKQLADTRASIVTEESKPVREQTTDQNPTYQYVSTELAKAKADYSFLQAQAAATETIVGMYRKQVEQLEQKGIVHQDLLRTQKADEDNYLLYLRKREEARMSDALDQRRILNVAVAEQPSVPVLPATSPWLVIALGLVLGVVVSTGTAIAADYLDSSFRTPAEVVDELQIPLLAAVPYQRSHAGTNGNGNGNGNGAHGHNETGRKNAVQPREAAETVIGGDSNEQEF